MCGGVISGYFFQSEMQIVAPIIHHLKEKHNVVSSFSTLETKCTIDKYTILSHFTKLKVYQLSLRTQSKNLVFTLCSTVTTSPQNSMDKVRRQAVKSQV